MCGRMFFAILLFPLGSLERERAEKVLEGRPVGSYLVRLSAKVWGYTISVKGVCV